MRKRETNPDGLSVHAIAGTYVVMLNMDLPESRCDGLLGFAVHRTDYTEDEAYFLTGVKVFEPPRGMPRSEPRVPRGNIRFKIFWGPAFQPSPGQRSNSPGMPS